MDERALENARKQLADGTWPQVLLVCGYKNPDAPRTNEKEAERLRIFYQGAACHSISRFVEFVVFAEKEYGVPVSFSFVMKYRTSAGDDEPTPENLSALFSCPDVMVGSRFEKKGAMDWLREFSESMPRLPLEAILIMDKIFGEALVFFGGPSRRITLEEMFRAIVSNEEGFLDIPEVPKTH